MQQDSPWKDILETLFPDFLAFFFPVVYKDIDFTKSFTFLDKELQQILKNSEIGKKIVDKLAKVYLKNGKEKWLLIHVEIQGAAEQDFAKRIYIYNYRIFDKFNKDVVSLAILADSQANFRENEYRVQHWGFNHQFQFPVIKLIDYADDWENLDTSSNPFARVVKAFLKTLETEKNIQDRFRWKRHLLLNLYESGFTKKTLIALYRFIEWIMTLPDELEDRILDEVIETEGGKKVPYVLYAERRAAKKGIYQNIKDILEIKFGEEGIALFEMIKAIDDFDVLQFLRNGLKKALTVIDAKNLISEQLEKLKQNNNEYESD